MTKPKKYPTLAERERTRRRAEMRKKPTRRACTAVVFISLPILLGCLLSDQEWALALIAFGGMLATAAYKDVCDNPRDWNAPPLIVTTNVPAKRLRMSGTVKVDPRELEMLGLAGPRMTARDRENVATKMFLEAWRIDEDAYIQVEIRTVDYHDPSYIGDYSKPTIGGEPQGSNDEAD